MLWKFIGFDSQHRFFLFKNMKRYLVILSYQLMVGATILPTVVEDKFEVEVSCPAQARQEAIKQAKENGGKYVSSIIYDENGNKVL